MSQSTLLMFTMLCHVSEHHDDVNHSVSCLWAQCWCKPCCVMSRSTMLMLTILCVMSRSTMLRLTILCHVLEHNVDVNHVVSCLGAQCWCKPCCVMSWSTMLMSTILCCAGSFHCWQGGYVSRNQVCDGNPDCADSSDEINCRKYTLLLFNVIIRYIRHSEC